MLFLIIGPSGVGKTACGRYAAQSIPGCRFEDLDELVSKRSGRRASELLPIVGNDVFFDMCRAAVDEESTKHPDSVTIVAVGAGALQSRKAPQWLMAQRATTITVYAEPREVYQRGGPRNANRGLTEFINTEYSPHRLAMYQSANNQCTVTGLSIEEAQERFVEIIRPLTAQATRP